MKEAIFLQEVRRAAAEERANKLRWYDYIIMYMEEGLGAGGGGGGKGTLYNITGILAPF